MTMANEKGGEKCGKVEANNGKDWPQVLAIFIVSLSSLGVGLLWCWSSPFSIVLTQDKINYNITEEQTSYFIVVQPVGMILFSLIYFKISEFLGTKKALWFVAVPQAASFITTIFAKTIWDFYVARFLAGIGDAVFFGAGPPFIGEITTPTIRGTWGFMPVFSVFIGAIIVTVSGSYLDVTTTSYICLIPVFLFLVLMWFLPESPYQSIRNGNYEEAKNGLEWYRRKPNIEDDFSNLKAIVEEQMSQRSSFKELFTIKTNRKGLRAGLLLRCGQQFSGVAIFMTYTQMIFQKAGSSFSPQLSSIIFVGTSAVLNLVCSFGVEKFGRKIMFVSSVFSCGVILFFMSAYFILDQYDIVDMEGLNWIPLVGLLGFIIAFSPGVGLVPTIMLGELFTGNIRYKGLTMLSGGFGVAVFIATNIFNLLEAHVGMYGGFLVFGMCCFCSGFLGLRWIPETKGKTLEEIQEILAK